MIKPILTILISTLLISHETSASYGVDLSDGFNNFTCLKNAGVEYVITRAWRSYGAIDPDASTNIRNAKNAGIRNVDVYMFPCRGKSAQDQVNEMINGLDQALFDIEQNEEEIILAQLEQNFNEQDQYIQSSYGKVWLDIETNPSSGCGWGTDYSSNCEYLKELVDAVKKNGVSPGIYSRLSSVPLWYAHYDGRATFTDYRKIADWSSPFMKQYKGDTTECDLGVDLDYFG